MRATPTSRAERQQARQRQARLSIAISATSTVVVLGAAGLALVLSPGWHTIRDEFFSWQSFRSAVPGLAGGFWLDVRIFLIVEAIVLALGLLIALVRTQRAPVLFPVRLV